MSDPVHLILISESDAGVGRAELPPGVISLAIGRIEDGSGEYPPFDLGERLSREPGLGDTVWVLRLRQDERMAPDDEAALARFCHDEALPGCSYRLHRCLLTPDATKYRSDGAPEVRLTAWERSIGSGSTFQPVPELAQVNTTFRLQALNVSSASPHELRLWRPRRANQATLAPAEPAPPSSVPLAVNVTGGEIARIEPVRLPARATPFELIRRHTPAPLTIDNGALPDGITHRLASVTTSYAMFAPPMAQNIATAARLLASMRIEAGGVFSLDRAFGPITEERGFTEGRVIAGGKISSDIGGGLCAVSTLVFRAALLAGLPFIRWNPHILRLPFYEQAGWPAGIDATYFQPNDETQKLVDLRFQNDTAWPMLLQLTAHKRLITAEIYGGPTGYVVELDGPEEIARRPARLIERKANWLAAGKRKRTSVPQDGVDLELWRTVLKDGSVFSERSFVSRYRPEHGIMYLGVATETAQTPASS